MPSKSYSLIHLFANGTTPWSGSTIACASRTDFCGVPTTVTVDYHTYLGPATVSFMPGDYSGIGPIVWNLPGDDALQSSRGITLNALSAYDTVGGPITPPSSITINNIRSVASVYGNWTGLNLVLNMVASNINPITIANGALISSTITINDDYATAPVTPSTQRRVDISNLDIQAPSVTPFNLVVTNNGASTSTRPPYSTLYASILTTDVSITMGASVPLFKADRIATYSATAAQLPPKTQSVNMLAIAYSLRMTLLNGTKFVGNPDYLFDYFLNPNTLAPISTTPITLTIDGGAQLIGRSGSSPVSRFTASRFSSVMHEIYLTNAASISHYNLTGMSLYSENSSVINCDYVRTAPGIELDTLINATFVLDDTTGSSFAMRWDGIEVSRVNQMTIVDHHPTIDFEFTGSSVKLLSGASLTANHITVASDTRLIVPSLTLTESLGRIECLDCSAPGYVDILTSGTLRDFSGADNLTLSTMLMKNVNISVNDGATLLTFRPDVMPSNAPIVTMINSSISSLSVGLTRIVWNRTEFGYPPFKKNYALIDNVQTSGYLFNSTTFEEDEFEFIVFTDQSIPDKVWFTASKDYGPVAPIFCAYPPPYQCLADGTVIVNGSIVTNTTLIVPGSAGVITVIGNVTVTNGSIVFGGSGSTLKVEGCVIVEGGGVVIDLTGKGTTKLPSTSGSVTLIAQEGSNCSSDLSKTPLSVKNDPKNCKKTSAKYDAEHSTKSALTVLFVIDSSKCDTKWIILGAVLGAVVIIALVALLVAYKIVLSRRKAKAAKSLAS